MRRIHFFPLFIAIGIFGNGHAHGGTDSLPIPKALYEGKLFLGDYRVNQTLLDGQKGLMMGATAGLALGLMLTSSRVIHDELGIFMGLSTFFGGGLGGLIGLIYGFTHGLQLEEEDDADPDFRARYRRFGFEWRGATGIEDFQEEYAALWILRKWKRNPRYLDELKFGLGISNRYMALDASINGNYFGLEEREFFLSGQKNWFKSGMLSPFTFLDAGLTWGKGYSGYGNSMQHTDIIWPLLRLGVGLKANAWDLIQGHVLISYNIIPAMTYYHPVPFEKHVAISVGLSSYCF